MNSEKIEIRGKTFRYPVFVGEDVMDQIGLLARDRALGQRCAVIADKNSARLFGQRICDRLTQQRFQPILISIPGGEHSKSFTEAERICDRMVEAGLDRSSFVVGLGGGVVGDVSGFVAAIFNRGIRHVQIPTTLLAMVDSAIGGKTGVNLQAGKNLVGVFHHPAFVLADIAALRWLAPKDLRQGYAEVVKHGIICDAEMLRELELRRLPLTEMVQRNVAIKAKIVAADERDISGERALLNFGHTIGHAIERASNFEMSHGDCVSLGIIGACQVSIKRAGLSSEERERVLALLKQFDLPTQLPETMSRSAILRAIPPDKKFDAGQIRFVVASKLGSAHVSRDVTVQDIGEAVDAL